MFTSRGRSTKAFSGEVDFRFAAENALTQRQRHLHDLPMRGKATACN
jgi:hypothetical protein